MPTLKDILDRMSAPTKADKALVEKAYHYAAHAHRDHKRFSGEPYLAHLAETAKGLAELGMSAKTVAAGLLHDSIEDVGVTPEQIEAQFGKEIRFLVEGVTKLGLYKYRGAERHRESLRKLLVATGQDARVLIIKLMDRLHNMRTLEHVPQEKRRRIALETLEIYAAIAHRLGMGLVRSELEDRAFTYAYPEEYAEVKKLIAERSSETAERLESMTRTLRKELAKNGLSKYRVDSRVKGLWSLAQKLKRKDGDISKVHDIAAVRVIVESVEDCYRALGLVHNFWQPLPNKIKDYIAFPKPNGYRGLHTTVFAGDGGIVEIQIRTKEMHSDSQNGIAAHVAYKEGGKGSHGGGQSSFDWIKSLIPSFRRDRREAHGDAPEFSRASQSRYGGPAAPEWLAELGEEADNPEFEKTLKTDIFTHRVFIFTPKGDVVDLPSGCTPLDFAYAIHSDIGDKVYAAKVNGKLVPLDTVLHNGDIVEIQTKKTAHPTKKWLDSARTTLARRHIRLALEREEKGS